MYPGELLPAAGVRLGAELALKMRGLARGGRDTLQAECKFNPSTEQFSLKKVQLQGMGIHECWECAGIH